MLDEILEYQQYTDDPAGMETLRLKYCELNNSLSGVHRALQTVARGFMNRDFSQLPPDEKFEKTKKVLCQWSGGYKPGADEEDFGSDIQDWFQRYIETMKSKEAKGNKDLVLARFEKRVRAFNGAEFYSPRKTDGNKSVNTENKITYEKVIHEAGRMGRLKRYYLVSCKPLEIKDLNKKTPTRSDGTPKKEQWDLILKATAAYLLESPKHNYADDIHLRYAMICWADVVNWSMGTFSEGSKILLIFSREGKPIFEMEPRQKQKNHTRLRPGSAFMDEYKWQLVLEEDLPAFKESHPGCAIYKDEGAGVALRRL